MNLLAFDTSTDTLSIAVQAGDAWWQHTGPGGAQTSATLVPAIRTLLEQAGLSFATLDAIVFGRGPGSFTGLRTACAVAQGLAFGAKVKVLAIDTLLAVAEEARAQQAPQADRLRVLALLDARMDELYAAPYDYAGGRWQQRHDFRLGKPEQVSADAVDALAGNVFAQYGERLPRPAALPCWQALPTAAAMLRLAPTLLAGGNAVPADQALPLYIRDKVALTTEERAAAKAQPSRP